MKLKTEIKVIDAERIGGGVVITFNDGRCAVYSAELLFETFPQAEELSTDPEEIEAD